MNSLHSEMSTPFASIFSSLDNGRNGIPFSYMPPSQPRVYPHSATVAQYACNSGSGSGGGCASFPSHALTSSFSELQSSYGDVSRSSVLPNYSCMAAAGLCSKSPTVSNSELSLTASLMSSPSAFEVYRQG